MKNTFGQSIEYIKIKRLEIVYYKKLKHIKDKKDKITSSH